MSHARCIVANSPWGVFFSFLHCGLGRGDHGDTLLVWTLRITTTKFASYKSWFASPLLDLEAPGWFVCLCVEWKRSCAATSLHVL